MSVSCEGFVGYTITLKENLNSADFDFFYSFENAHKEYSQYTKTGKVSLVVDGMNGVYARLIFVEEYIEDCWVNGKDYRPLKSVAIPDDVYDELNKAYKIMYGKNLDKDLVEYALWFHFA